MRDRLSELPNSIIFHIFWFVPMNDVVRTTILSKRWRNLWTTVPFLNFYNDTPSHDYGTVKFQNFVNRALLRWNGIRVLKFKVDTSYELEDNSIYNDIELWLNFAKEKRIEELYLHILSSDLKYAGHIEMPQCLPQCLFSCSSLKILSFKFCYFTMAKNVQWNQLKSLTITEWFEVTEHAINQILSGSPQLEVLNLSFVDRGENLIIRSNSLKELSICNYLHSCDDLNMVSELTIWTPNLETLKIIGIPYTNCRLIDVSSLTDATIGFCGLIYTGLDCCDLSDCVLENGFLSSQDYIGDKFSQILQTLQHVESVTLLYCCLKVLRSVKKRCMHSSFPNVKSLKIGDCYNNYEELVGLLEIFPQLERLVLQLQSERDCERDDPEAVKYETSIPKSFLMQLRAIEINWYDDDSIFPALEILLKYASKLEKMVFQVRKLQPKSLLLAATKLLNMPRSSAKCKIDILYD